MKATEMAMKFRDPNDRIGMEMLLALCELALAVESYRKIDCQECDDPGPCEHAEAAWEWVRDNLDNLRTLGLLPKEETR